MQPFTARVIEIIQAIPEGRVMTYGQVSSLAGSPRGARQVVRILHSMGDKYKLPWHRVLNAKGEIVLNEDESSSLQKLFLMDEGVEFIEEKRIQLEIYQFHPE